MSILTNDMRANAAPVDVANRARTNLSASTEGGEVQTCGTAPYGRTVWFRYVAPAEGRVTFAASRFDIVTALYRGNATSPFMCTDNDSGNPLSSTVFGDVKPGEVLYLQVGGKGSGAAAVEDNFTLNTTFAEDQDIDNDGYNKRPGPDCDDADPSVHPQQIETPNNGKDDDCAGGDSHDTDLDGQDAEPYGPDCDDGNDAIFKGAAEIRGNFVDENCDDKTPAAQLSPFPAVSYSHVAVLAGRQFGVLKVTSVAKGYRIAVRCRGSSRCPKKFTKKTKSRRAVTTNRYKRTFGPGAEVEIRVTKPGVNRYGYFVEYKVVAPRDVVKRTCKIQPKSGRLTGCRRA
jgi:hypothetical protein